MYERATCRLCGKPKYLHERDGRPLACDEVPRPLWQRFPIMDGPSLPWAMLEPHEQQARRNHDQSLARLAERGGLAPCEALAVLDDRKWRRMPHAEAHAELKAHLKAWDEAGLRAALAAAEQRALEAERRADGCRQDRDAALERESFFRLKLDAARTEAGVLREAASVALRAAHRHRCIFCHADTSIIYDGESHLIHTTACPWYAVYRALATDTGRLAAEVLRAARALLADDYDGCEGLCGKCPPCRLVIATRALDAPKGGT